MSKRFSKYIAFFDYFDKSLIALSAISVGICIALFATIIDAPIGIISGSFSPVYSMTTVKNCNKLLKTTRNKKEKHNKVAMLARSKLNSIERKISEALINNGSSHEDFTTIMM